MFVSTTGILGGAEHSLLLLVQALTHAGVDCHVALLQDGPLRARFDAIGVGSSVLPVAPAFLQASRYSMSVGVIRGAGATIAAVPAAWRLSRVATEFGADVIHSNGMKAHTLAGLAGHLSHVPVVWHVRDFPPPGFAGRAFHHQLRLFPALVLANSEAVRRVLVSDRTPVMALHNPVDLDRFHPRRPKNRIRAALHVDACSPMIGLVAHLTPWKGHELFLGIARDIADEMPQARFVIAGGNVYRTDGHDGYADRLRDLANELGLTDRVIFLGARDDVADVLADLDVLVHCPLADEPFGRAIAEAMAAGTPVVAARCGGIPELVQDGGTGILVTPGDRAAFSQAVLRVLSDKEYRVKLGTASRARAEAMFALDAHAAAVLEAYGRVTATRH